MKDCHLAQQLIVDGNHNSTWSMVGVFEDKQMALSWVNENIQNRGIKSIPLLDKTFAQMSVEYNHGYEG